MSVSKFPTSDSLDIYPSNKSNNIRRISQKLRNLEETEITSFKALSIKIFKEDLIQEKQKQKQVQEQDSMIIMPLTINLKEEVNSSDLVDSSDSD